ncbi:MAG: ferredoxin-type protein NapG [bacterium]
MTTNGTRPTSPSRRQFLQNSLRVATGAGLVMLTLGVYQRQASALPASAIRPPGVGDEKDFLGACVRCGLCVRDCPFDTLKLAQLGERVALGTPYFEARSVPCEMCDDIPCVKACPTGALDQTLTDITKARMGLAVVVDQEACIAFQGLRCEVCFNVCPVRGEAITLDYQHNTRSGKHAFFIPVVHSSDCTGCGKCERACILEEAAIKIFPIHLAKGLLGEHYRLGWEEQSAAGKPLVSPDVPHQYNLPEGMQYDHGGEGLIPDPSGATKQPPFSNNPLDTLNRKGGI